MSLAQAQLLQIYLRAVRQIAVRRALGTLLVDLGLGLGVWALVVIGFAGATARGDLAATLGGALGLIGIAAVGFVRISRLRDQLSDSVALARAIASTPGPLRSQATASQRERDGILRHELLGATELWLQLERLRSGGPTGAQPTSSPDLAAAYVRRVGAQTVDLDPRYALPRAARLLRSIAATLMLAAGIGLLSSEFGVDALALVRERVDGRPPIPAQPVWTSVELVLDYPDYTRRADRRVPNPSGTMRVPAGTRVTLDMTASSDADAARVVVIPDATELATAPDPEVVELELVAERRWTGTFELRGTGTWVVALLDHPQQRDAADVELAPRRSPPMRVEVELDALPEVELLPQPDDQREASETDQIDLRFVARDDFGVVSAELVYEIAKPDGELERRRLPAGAAPTEGSRSWRHHHRWDLSSIPIEDRSEVTYWIEIRDNDPGLGLVPLIDGPGKIAASARQQLLVHDEEAEHAENIRDLQAIRDAAVDLLAARLTTGAFEDLDVEARIGGKLRTARDLHTGAAGLLTMIAAAVDALAVDTMIAERDVETLAGIHGRLLTLHREEAKLHEGMAPGAELERPEDRAPLLRELGRHNIRELEQLEDEIIRLDDLVDGQIIARIEALVARLQVSQQKMVEKLEQLQAGDESVRPEIEQLEQRIRDDMRRVQEAQAELRKEVGDEWMNLDAFKAMEARMRSQALLEQLKRGDIDGALEQAREGLDAIRQLREQVQQTGAQEDAPGLSEEDRKRMKMLRELSRLQDDETGLRAETRRLREQWRTAVGGRKADPDAVEQASEQAKQLREGTEAINDSNLSRDGREAWDKALEALEGLEAAASDGEANELELFEAANEAAAALRRAQAGAKPGDAEAKALDKLADRAERIREGLREPLPDPDDVLDPSDIERLTELGRQQSSLREQARRLLDDPAADILPAPGRQAMDGAGKAMRAAGEALDDAALDGALLEEDRAWQGIQRAIDSLRESSPPPPQASEGESSTEAERDRSLRDQVVEAMREGDRDDLDDDTKRYYEELLR